MAVELGPRGLPLVNVRNISPIRCELDGHCNVSTELKLQKAELKQKPGITVDTEKLAAILEGMAKPTEHTEEISEEPASVKITEAITPAKRRWEKAVGKVAKIAERLAQTETPDVMAHGIDVDNLFNGLRDSHRSERTMERVEVLYESISATRR